MRPDNYNPYSTLAKVERDQEKALERYTAVVKALFPTGSIVRVNHYRGSYRATVTGHDPRYHRLIVENVRTGKTSRPHPGLRVGIRDDSVPCVEREG